MSTRWTVSITVLAAVVALFLVVPGNGQAPARTTPQVPRMPDGKPNFTGLWQALGTAYWDIRDHSAQPGPFFQLGATGAMPAGPGIVEGGEIPYLPAAAAKQKENLKNRMTLDPEIKCYMPGIPRANYMSFPFQIIQSQKDIAFAYEYATANRVVNMGKPKEAQVDTWMGTSNGRWEGQTLVVDVTGLNGQSWFDRSGNFMSENVHVVSISSSDSLSLMPTISITKPQSRTVLFFRGHGKSACRYIGAKKRMRSSANSNALNSRKS